MFSKKKPKNMAKNQEPVGGSHSIINNGTEIKGDIKSTGDIRIDGKLIGNISVKGLLILGQTGVIEGDIVCKKADIQGVIKGKITISELIALKENAKINGDIITNKISIEPGASFTGTCTMDGSSNTAVGANVK